LLHAGRAAPRRGRDAWAVTSGRPRSVPWPWGACARR